MKFIGRAINTVIHPIEIWSKIKEEKLSETIRYLIYLTITATVIFYFIGNSSSGIDFYNQIFHLINTFSNIGIPMPSTYLGGVLVWFSIFFIFIFIQSKIIHTILRLMKIKGGYSDGLKSLVYGSTPQVFLGLFPVIGEISYIYMIWLQIKGLSELVKISFWKSFLIYLLLMITLLILIFGPIVIYALSLL
tara:strand:+ start:298 stop:870 length:573 start_codon:yes stop_codon:yes gene_type:complete